MRSVYCCLKDARHWQLPINFVKGHAFAVKRFWHLAVGLVLSANIAYAAKFGPLQVNSTLGAPLSVALPLYDVEDFDVSHPCVNASVTSLDGQSTIRTRLQIVQGGDHLLLQVLTDQSVTEPALAISIMVTCGTAFTRNFQFLLDPPEMVPLLAKSAPETLAPVQEVPPEASPTAMHEKPVNVKHARVAGAPPFSGEVNSGARRQRASIQGKAKSPTTASVSNSGSSVLRLSLDAGLEEQGLRAAAQSAAVLQGETQRPVAADLDSQSPFAKSPGADGSLHLEKTLAAFEAESRALHTAMQRLQQEMQTERLRSAEKLASMETWLYAPWAVLTVSVVALGWTLMQQRSRGDSAKKRKRFDPASILTGTGQRVFAKMRSRYGTKHASFASSGKSDVVEPPFDKQNNESISESSESISVTVHAPSLPPTATESAVDRSADLSLDFTRPSGNVAAHG